MNSSKKASSRSPTDFELHDRAANALEVGQDRAQPPAELVGLLARGAQHQRRFPLPPVRDVRRQFLHRLEAEPDGHDQAAEALRHILVEAREALDHQERAHRHVYGDLDAILLFFQPARGDEPRVDLARERERLVARFGGAPSVGPPDAPPPGRDHLGQPFGEVVALAPHGGVRAHHVVDRVHDLLRRRERRRAGEEPVVQVDQARLVQVLVGTREYEERVVVQVPKQRHCPLFRATLALWRPSLFRAAARRAACATNHVPAAEACLGCV